MNNLDTLFEGSRECIVFDELLSFVDDFVDTLREQLIANTLMLKVTLTLLYMKSIEQLNLERHSGLMAYLLNSLTMFLLFAFRY